MMLPSAIVWRLAHVAQVLEHAARIGEGRVLGQGLVWEPVADLRGECHAATTDKQDALEFGTLTELALGLSVQAPDTR